MSGHRHGLDGALHLAAQEKAANLVGAHDAAAGAIVILRSDGLTNISASRSASARRHVLYNISRAQPRSTNRLHAQMAPPSARRVTRSTMQHRPRAMQVRILAFATTRPAHCADGCLASCNQSNGVCCVSAEGANDSLMGKAKNAIGSLTGNDQMQAEGRAREVRCANQDWTTMLVLKLIT